MAVYTCCQKEVATVSRYATAYDVAQLMERKNADIVVVTEDDKPIGIITDRDLVLRVLVKHLDPEATCVEDIMTEDPFVLDESTGLYDAMKCGRDWNIRRMPIVDAEGKLMGIITLDDIIRLLVEEITWVAHIIEKVSTPEASA